MSAAINFFIYTILAIVATALSASDREPLSTTTTTTVEHFTLGSTVDGAIPIYQFQETVTPNIDQSDIVVNIQYPQPNADTTDNDVVAEEIITKVSLYLEGDEGFTSQAYTIAGGIGERSITLQVVVTNTESLRYIVIIDGLKA